MFQQIIYILHFGWINCVLPVVTSTRIINYLNVHILFGKKYCESIFIHWHHFFVVSTKSIDPWVLKLAVSNITGNSQWENCISLDFNFRSLSEPRNSRK